ncbi:hypothetical protein BMS3Bbin01_00104 [bacterium BMS3Bbin01]|nr:hypothetical protein BMS3Bbin01_00104 [bacterium BMS3Bbin01]
MTRNKNSAPTSFSSPSGGSAESSRRWGCTRTGAAGARPLRGKCRVFEAMGVYQDRRSRSKTPQTEVPSLRGDGGVPGPAQPEQDPSDRSAESSRRWRCGRDESLPHRPRPKPRGHFPCKGKERDPIDLGQSPEATSPARGSKKDGSVFSRSLPVTRNKNSDTGDHSPYERSPQRFSTARSITVHAIASAPSRIALSPSGVIVAAANSG